MNSSPIHPSLLTLFGAKWNSAGFAAATSKNKTTNRHLCKRRHVPADSKASEQKNNLIELRDGCHIDAFWT